MKKTRKFIVSIILLLSISFLSCTKPAESITDKYKQELQNTADEFQNKLKNVLGNELQTNGVISALSVCSDTAQLLTKTISDSNQVVIKRVSFKLRNSANKPDSFEEKTLKNFESMFLAGKLSDTTYYIEITGEGSKQFIRFMKPIFVQPPCLLCHGNEKSFPVEVSEKLRALYPSDNAKNYKTGDLRGAISIKKLLSNFN